MKNIMAFAAISAVLLGWSGCATSPKPSDRIEPPTQASPSAAEGEERFIGIGAALRKADPSAIARAYSDRGIVKLVADDDHKGAIEDFTVAIGYKPSGAELYVERGICYLKIGNRKAAKDDFDKASSLDKNLGASLTSLLGSGNVTSR